MADPLPLDVVPGSAARVECPAGSAPLEAVGRKLPDDKAPWAVVVRAEENALWIGPVKPGEPPVLEVPCGKDQSVAVKLRLVEVKPEDLPEHVAPLAPSNLSYPLWLLLIVAAFFAATLGGALWIRRRHAHTFSPPKLPPTRTATPTEKLDELIRTAHKEAWTDPGSPARRLYAESYDVLRLYLESKLGFRAQEATTKEFLGELRAALLGKGGTTLQTAGLVESLLNQADQVRFAGENPASEMRVAFLKGVETVRGAL